MPVFCRIFAAKLGGDTADGLKKSPLWPKNNASDRFLTLAPTILRRDQPFGVAVDRFDGSSLPSADNYCQYGNQDAQ